MSELTSYTSPKIVEICCDLLTNGIEREYITNLSFVRPEPMSFEDSRRALLEEFSRRVPYTNTRFFMKMLFKGTTRVCVSYTCAKVIDL